MKPLQATCLVLSVLLLSMQLVRHIYVKYLENTSSVMDEFDPKSVQREIENAETLAELVEKYRPARKREDELEAIMKEKVKDLPENDREKFRNEFQIEHEKDYARSRELRLAIVSWESKAKEIRELRILWGFGVGLLLAGCLLYFVNRWLGMAFVIPGIVEMMWWTSPSFRFAGTVKEFERLLTNKLVLTGVTLIVVIALWLFSLREWRKSS